MTMNRIVWHHSAGPLRPTATDRRRSLASIGMGGRFRLAGSAFSAEAGIPLAADGPHKSVNLFFSTTKSF